jgi:hypothetical protein
VETIKRIFLIEQSGDIDNAVSWKTGEMDNSVFIALRPVVGWELECRGIACRTILSYGDGRKRWVKTLENFAILDEITAEIDFDITDFLAVKTLEPAVFSYYYLKILLDVMTTKILLLKTIISAETPDEVIAYHHEAPASGSYFPFSEEESVFSLLLELGGWDVPVRILRLGMQTKSANISTANTRMSALTRCANTLVKNNNLLSNFLFNAAFISKHFGVGESVAAFLGSRFKYPKKPVTIYGCGYNWDYSLPILSRAGIHPVYRLFGGTPAPFASADIDEIATRIRAICNGSERIKHLAVMAGIDTSSLLFEKIASIISRAAVSCEREYHASTGIFRKTGVRCILVSTQASHLDRAVIQAAHDHGVQVISWQHGGAGFCYHPFMYQAEFFRSDIHLVFGEGVAESFRKTSALLGLEKIPRFIPVGSALLDQERETIAGAGNTVPNSGPVVYITEKFQFNLYYNSTTFDSTEICDHFWEVQRRILDLAGNHQDIPVTFKLHPADSDGEPARSYAQKYNLTNVMFIVQEQTIQDLIPSARAIIIDFVSTSVLEATLSEKPVFIYTGMFSMDKEPLALLEKRAFLYDSLPALFEEFEKFLIAGPTAFAEEHGVDYRNTEFIQSFGTYRHDGESSHRAVAEMKAAVFPER